MTVRDAVRNSQELEVSGRGKTTKTELVERLGKQYLATITTNHLDSERFERLLMLSFDQTPDLVKCLDTEVGRASIALAAVKSFAAGLEVGTATNESKILPSWDGRNKCTVARLSIEYKGYVLLASRNGAAVTAKVVYENDEFEYGSTLDGDYLTHKPTLGDPGEMVAAWAIARYPDGRRYLEVMGRTEIERHRAESESFKGKFPQYSPWVKWPESMWRKTVTRVLCRRQLNLSDEFASAIDADEAELTQVDGRIAIAPYRNDGTPADEAIAPAPEPEPEPEPEPAPAPESAPTNVDADGVIDAEIIDEEPAPNPTPEPIPDQTASAEPANPIDPDGLLDMLKQITDECRRQRILAAARYAYIASIIGREIKAMGELTVDEATTVLHELTKEIPDGNA